MGFGSPHGASLYKLLSDWGSFISGVFAPLAGVLAYVAGVKQAHATREAARDDITRRQHAFARVALKASPVIFGASQPYGGPTFEILLPGLFESDWEMLSLLPTKIQDRLALLVGRLQAFNKWLYAQNGSMRRSKF